MNPFKRVFYGRASGTPQLVQAHPNEIANSAGGFVYAIDPWARLDRFLIIGSEGGTYYAAERELTVDNAQHLAALVREDGVRAVERIMVLSGSGRAPKVSPMIFALAMCAGFGNDAARRLALGRGLQTVCRTGSHLLEFASYVEQFRGWGRGLRAGMRAWYDSKPVGELAYQVVKYQNRAGFTHRDVMRLAHPVVVDEARNALYAWIVRGTVPGDDRPELSTVSAFECAKTIEQSELDVCVALVRKARLPREALPTQWLREPAVWEALLDTMPMAAMIRNLASMTRVGLLTPKSPATEMVIERLHDAQRLRKARVHPIAILSALETYASGHGARGGGTWNAVDSIIEALDDAFYLAFAAVEPSGARTLVGLDVSGSMAGGRIAGVPGLTPRVASVAMALTHMRTEERVDLMAFSDRFVKLDVGREHRLSEAMRATADLPFERTDCALPMLYALEHRLEVDAFVIYTDNETWAGSIHPDEALRRYRRRMDVAATLVVVGMTSTGFSIADPNDAGMLDVVGFDAGAPALIADFSRPVPFGA